MKEDITTKIKERFSDKIKELTEKYPNTLTGTGGHKSAKRIYFSVAKEDIPRIVKFIYKDLGARFITVSGMDTPVGIEMLYHFVFDEINNVVSVRTLINKHSLETESIAPMIKGAEWIEREIWELLGVKFNNHPNLKRLLLTDDWPEGEHPLRREE